MTIVAARPWRSSRIFEQVAALGGGERREAPVVEDQQFGAGDGLEGAGVSAVASGERQRLEEARDAVV